MMESHLRFSIANMLTATFAIGVVITAMATANQVLAVVITNVVWAFLFAAILGAVYRPHRRQRAFWFGFALFGWGFFFTFAYPDTVPPNLFADFACRATSW